MRRARKINPGKSLGCTLDCRTIKRLFARVELEPATGCWLWTGYCDPQGYGQVRVGEKVFWIHRVMYSLLKSRKLTGVEVDHNRAVCCHRNCCNPAHLRRSTPSGNRIDANVRRATPPPLRGPILIGFNTQYGEFYA